MPGAEMLLPVAELAGRDSGVGADGGQEGGLPGCDAEVDRLAAHESRQPQEDGPKLVCEGEGVVHYMNH